MHDAAVVGGGPAGLAAATWLARYRQTVVLVDSGEHRNRWVEHAHGYLGQDPMHPADFIEQACEQLGQYPEVERREGRVTTARANGDGTFTLTLEGIDEAPLRVRRIVLCTGVRDAFPEIDGFFEHYGASVFHCPGCDGYEAKGKRVVALGSSPALADFAVTLRGWAASVTLVTDRPVDPATPHLDVIHDDPVAFVGERGALEGVRLRSGDVVPCELAFFSIAHHFNADLADQLGCARTDEGCVRVDDEGATSVPGVYAAGDLVPGLHLVQVAAAKGTVAGVACACSLRVEMAGYTGAMAQEQNADRARQELDQLGDEIHEVRNRVAEENGEDEPLFIQEGRESEDQPVDDTIAPPG